MGWNSKFKRIEKKPKKFWMNVIGWKGTLTEWNNLTAEERRKFIEKS